ncbi:MAG: hypothetical protein KJP08_00950 [Gammaproteobacteria bacterium]|nr:hypothetical protein [Gammaproteobacteria bacterium]NNF50551.1 hypothetical protein [Woeseiaceae bacterium]MBT8093350.1 hypothetical protein [Gammaproteobacteria bacterium]MBT8104395.1 hypothetical protein [Gammaproteobacteria bacterium]NNK24411.1 hypothetical protein [Woeseiaceae bacterium]
MSDKKVVKPVVLAVGAALAGSFAIAGTVNAAQVADSAESPFQFTNLEIGYMMGEGEGSCGEGSCGEGDDKEGEGSCGEGSCGESDDSEPEGSCGEGSCGEGDDKEGEGSCGEGSCGGSA